MADTTDITMSIGLDISEATNAAKTLKNVYGTIFDSIQKKAVAQLSSIGRIQDSLSKLYAKRDLGIDTTKDTEQITRLEEELKIAEDLLAKMFINMTSQQVSPFEPLVKDMIKTGELSEETANKLKKVGNISLIYGDDLTKVSNASDNAGKSQDTLNQKFAKQSEEIKRLKSELAEMSKQLKQLSKTSVSNRIGKISKSFNNMSKSVHGTGAGLNKATRLVKKFILAGLGVRSIYFLFRKFWKMVIDGVNIMAQVDSSTNKALSDIKTASYSLQKQIGSLFSVLVQAVAPAITAIINLITRAIDAVTRLFAIIGGKTTYKKATTQVQDYASSLDKSSKSAKKAKDENKKYMSGLDEIATWQDKNKDSGSGDDAGLANAYEDVPVGDLGNKWQKVKDILDNIRKLFMSGFWKGLGDWQSRVDDIKKNLESIKKSLIEIFTDPRVSKAIKDYAESVIYNLGLIAGSVVSIGLTIGQNIVGGIAKYLDENTEYLKDRIASIFEVKTEIWNLVGEFSTAFAYIFEAFGGENGQQLTANIIGIFAGAFLEIELLASKIGRDILTYLLKPIIDNKDIIRDALDNTLGWMAELAGLVKDVITDLGKSINKFYDTYIKPNVDKLTELVSQVVKEVVEAYNSYIAPVLTVIMKDLRELWSNTIKPVVDKLLALIGQLVTFLTDAIVSKIKPLLVAIKPVIAVLATVAEGTWKTIKGVLEGAFKFIGLTIDWISAIFKAFTQLLKGDFQGAFETVFSSIKSIISGLTGVVNSMVNGVIDGINVLLRGANSVLNKIPSSVKSTIGLANFSIPEIPKLAQGAVIPANSPFLAMLGDQRQGTNIEAPLETIKQAVAEVVGSNNGRGGNYEFVAQINRRTLFDEMITEAKLRQSASGRNPFEFA